jgi:hypothetical protein
MRQPKRSGLYLLNRGWVASTARLGDGRTHELQIALDVIGRSATLALAYFVSDAGDANFIGAWPGTTSSSRRCANDQLVQGYVPQRLRFEPRAWTAIVFAP